MKISAAVVREKGGAFSVEELDLSEPGDDEVLVRVVASGICHTDLIIRDQFYPTPMPVVLGHEGAGVVEQVGANVRHVSPGDHVVMSYNYCGACPSCHDGAIAYCWHHMEANFSGERWDVGLPAPLSKGDEHIHGSFFAQSSFATHAIAGAKNVVKVPSDAPLEILGPLGCGFQTGAGGVINSLRPKAGSSIAVFGAGAVGTAAIMAAAIVGCETIIAVDIVDDRLELASELGATHVLNGSEGRTVEAIADITGGGVQYAIETTANPKVFRQAVDALAVGGVCGLIGGAKLGTEASFEMTSILFGRTIRGILQGDSVPKNFIPRLVDFHLAGRFPIDRLVKFYDLEDVNQAVSDADNGRVIKPILRMPHAI